jgi:hypothetical protein
MAVNGQGAGNVAHRHLVGHLLDLDFLERNELGSTSRQEQLTLGVILLAVLRQTLGQRHELLRSNGLENFTTADVAGVSIDLDGGLDVRDASGDTADGNQAAEMLSAHVSDSKRLAGTVAAGTRRCEGLEVEGVSSSQLWGEKGCSGSSIHVGLCLHFLGLVALLTLGHDHV